MELLFLFGLLLALAIASLRWGCDSRDDFTDLRPRGLF